MLDTFQKNASSLDWDPVSIHNQIYEIIEEQAIEPKQAFSSIYQVILGQNKGPRIGYFLSNLEKEFVLTRLMEAIK